MQTTNNLLAVPHAPHPNLAGLRRGHWNSANSISSASSDSTSIGCMSESSDAPYQFQGVETEKRGQKRGREDISNVLEYVSEPPEHLKCAICVSVFTNPVIVNGCGHEFCEDCLRKSLGVKAECPMCRKSINVFSQFATPLRRLQEEADSLEVCCPFSHDGCGVSLRRKELKEHVSTCSFAGVDCIHAGHGCRWQGSRGALSHHLRACEFEKLKGFTSKTSCELAEARATVKAMEGEVKRLRLLEGVMKLRADRVKQSQRHKLGIVDPAVKDQVTVVHVMGKGVVQGTFRVKMTTKLGKMTDMLQQKLKCPVVLTCDGPLSMGGTVIDKDETLFEIGATCVDPSVGFILYAEFL